MQRVVCLGANSANFFLQPPNWPELLTRFTFRQQVHYTGIMRFSLLAGLASLASFVSATALTYRLEANEKACFYTNVEQANAKVAFYFAVSTACFARLIQSFLHFGYVDISF